MPSKKTSKKAAKPTSTIKATKKSTTSLPAKKAKPSVKTAPIDKSSATKNITTTSEKSATPTVSAVRVRKSFLLFVALILIIGGLLYYYRGFFVAAVVNGQPISRLAVVHETEKQSGKTALNTLVRNALIEQEAQKEHVTVSDQEVNDEMKTVANNLQKQGQNLNAVLATQGMTTDDLRRLVRLDKLVQKMVGKDIKITDQQVNDYIDKNKDMLPTNETQTQLEATVKNQLQQQALNQKVSTWLDNLQNKAKILYFVQY